MRRGVFVLWSILWVAPASAEPDAPQVDHWTSADGLPVDYISDLALTPDGMVWVATFDGLWTFDGLRFGSPPEAAQVGASRLNALAVSPTDGALWLLGELTGTVRIHQGEVRQFLPDVRGLALEEDEDGLWLTTSDGLYRLGAEPERFAAERVRGVVAGTARGPDGSRWVGLREGRVQRFHPNGVVEELGLHAGVPDHVQQLLGLDDGGIWLVADHDRPDAAFQWDGQTFVPAAGSTAGPAVCARQPWRTAVLCRPEGAADGPWEVSEHEVSWRGEPVLRLDVVIRTALVDSRGDLWLGTRGEGIYRLREPLVGVVSTGEVDDRVDMVWLSSSGLPWLRRYAGGWWGPEGLMPGSETGPHEVGPLSGAFLFRGNGGLLAVTHSGIVHLSDEAMARITPVSTVDCFGARGTARDRLGRTWVAGDAGLCLEEEGQWRRWQAASGAPSVGLLSVAELDDGSVLVGQADGGLVRVTSQGEARPVSGTERIRVRHVERQAGRLWLSTLADGLCVVDVDGPVLGWSPRCAGPEQGLPARGVHQAVFDERGRMWFSSNRGIGVLSAAELSAYADGQERLHPLVLGVDDGMAEAEANGGTDHSLVLDARGVLWSATQRGAATLDTRAFELPSPPAAQLVSVEVGGARQPSTDLNLAADHEPMTVRWTAPATRHADQLRFRTRLNAGTWTETEQRELTLARIPSGPFTFEIEAGLAGSWGSGAVLRGDRAPRLLERAWVWWLLSLAGALAVGGLAAARGAVLRRRNRELEATVAERTTALRRQARTLEEQAAQLSDLDSLKSRMIVNLHHELRTPLSLVIGPLRQRAEGADAELRLALRNAERLETLVGQLAEVARLEAGETRLVARPQRLAPMIRRCLERYPAFAAERGQELHFETSEEALVAWVDAKLFDDALGNLVHNALKFGPPRGTVGVGLLLDGQHARVEVRDQGPGVPEADRPRVFDRLYQVHRGDDRAYEGSGLGLAIAREMVELHGGEIGCEPDPGGGCCFWFTIPLGVGHLSPDALDLGSLPRLPPPPPQAEGSREDGLPLVLVVEDHPDMRAWLATVLGEGFSVRTAKDGAEGLALARQLRPRVVVTDVMMPVMDGVTMLCALRADPALADIGAVVVSAKTGHKERVAGLEVADAWLAKPFYAPELRAHVTRLAGRGSSQTLEASEPAVPLVDQALLERLGAALDARLDDSALTMDQLAKAVGMSRRTLQRELGRIAGVDPSTWVREHRLDAARTLLRRGGVHTVAEAAAAVGMSRAYFTRAYHAWCGRAPGEDLNGS